MVFGAIRAGKGLKADCGVGALRPLSASKGALVLGATGVLAVIAVALVAFVRVGG